ncbi:CDGP domain-containing protein, partial [Mycobacterium avium]
GPVQPDGTWQRCVAVTRLIPNGASSYLVPDGHCEQLGPDQHPADLAFADPPGHID